MQETKEAATGDVLYRYAILLLRGLRQRWFLVNFIKSLRTPFLQKISGRLFLKLKNGFCYSHKNIFGHHSGLAVLILI